VDAFWLDPSSNRTLGVPRIFGNDAYGPQGPNPFYRGVIVINSARGSTLTFETNYIGAPMRLDKVRGPAVVDLPMAMAPTPEAPNLVTLEPTSEAAVVAACGAGNVAKPWAYDLSFGTVNGLSYLRCAVTPQNQRAISWFLGFAPQREVYARYCLFIEDDVALGMTELGVKLPGLAGPEVSWRLEHGRRDPANPNLYSALDYRYSADSGSGYGLITAFNQLLRAGRWYVFEEYVKANTFDGATPKADGAGKVWINGHPVWSSDKVMWNRLPASMLNHIHVNIYHGGMGLPTRNIHYRIAAIAASTRYIGPPSQLAPR
jgi:hypothetical protein